LEKQGRDAPMRLANFVTVVPLLSRLVLDAGDQNETRGQERSMNSGVGGRCLKGYGDCELKDRNA
jgi:hypothetical protein